MSVEPPTNQPGDRCTDPRETHPHWCGFCGAELHFTRIQCETFIAVPGCPRCGERQWRSEVDGLTAPDFREEWRL